MIKGVAVIIGVAICVGYHAKCGSIILREFDEVLMEGRGGNSGHRIAILILSLNLDNKSQNMTMVLEAA